MKATVSAARRNEPSLVNTSPSLSWRRVLRGPFLWLVGVSSMAIVYGVQWRSIASSGALLPWLVMISVVYFVALCYVCTILFTSDCYDLLVQPTLRSVVHAAGGWSLDDVFRFLWDPTQLAATLSTCIFLPTALYTLPTTPEQRARVLEAVGLLPNEQTRATDVLTEAGGWKVMLPPRVQQFLHQVENVTSTAENDGAEDTFIERRNESATDEASTDEDDADCVVSSPTSKADPLRSSTHCNPPQKSEASVPTEQPISADEEVYNLLRKVLRDMMQQNLNQVCDSLRRHQKIPTTVAAVAATLVAVHLRQFPKARAMGANLMHLLVLTVAGTTVATSIVALLAPYAYDRPSAASPLLTRVAPLALLRSLIHSASSALPQSLGSTSATLTRLARGMVRWKGTIAVWVLAYFQYRRRRLQGDAK